MIVDDSRTYKGVVLGIDSLRDLAIVTICCGRFEALPLGQASSLKVGSEVVAMGYALAYSGSATVTRGIVSAFRYDTDRQRSVIQMDAPINPGNSGGPLFTLSGEIVGINTFKQDYTTSGRPTEGLGFAISEVTIRSILPDLKIGKRFISPTPTLIPTSTLRPALTGKWEIYDNAAYKYRLEVPSGWTINDSSPDAVEILSPEPDFIRLFVYYGGTTALTSEGYANTVLKALGEDKDFSYKLLRRSGGGYSRYKTAQLDYEVSIGTDYCKAMLSILVAIVKSDRQVFHVLSMRICPDDAKQYAAPLERILDSFFLYR